MTNLKKLFTVLLCLLTAGSLPAMASDRWKINADGGITWHISEDIPHEDHIEMSGLKVSTVSRYGVDASWAFTLNRSVVWPMLRTIPNNTHASLMRRFAWDIPAMVEINGKSLTNEKVKEITLDGTMEVSSRFDNGIELERILFPSTTQAMTCEKYTLTNKGDKPVSIEVLTGSYPH